MEISREDKKHRPSSNICCVKLRECLPLCFRVFGPRMQLSFIGGQRYFEPTKGDEKDNWSTNGSVMTVSHDPGCGLKGNNAENWFFRSTQLSPNASLQKAAIYWQKPDGYDAAEGQWLGDEIKTFATNFWAGVIDMSFMAIGMAFDSHYGSYKVEVPHQPTAENPSFWVHWENTCVEMYSGKPVVYTSTFMIWAPEGSILE
jgi:hypothetical protein